MSKAIPEGLSQRHVLLAIRDLEAGAEHPFGKPTGYELVLDGKHFPPKAVVGMAFRHFTGSVLMPDEFSGGEGPGQANHALRALGFVVEQIPTRMQAGFITSRSVALPTSADEIAGQVWFNLWKLRLWPYKRLSLGDTVWWYSSIDDAIVWKTTVSDVERFEYKNKEQIRQRLHDRFDFNLVEDSYYATAKENGYCLAYKVTPIEQINLPKPADLKVPQMGWLRSDGDAVRTWLSIPSLNQNGIKDKPKTVRNPPWTRDELILALELYFRHNPGSISKAHPEVLALSKTLNGLPIHPHRPDGEHFRNANGVYMKLCNFLRFDPTYDGVGLTAGNKLEEEVWNNFASDIDQLKSIAAKIREASEVVDIASSDWDGEEEVAEGRILLAVHKRHERSSRIVKIKKESFLKQHGILYCEACGFDFLETYGEIGEEFIECHHTIPISEAESNGKTKLKDLALVCANCHRMIHRKKKLLSVEELQQVVSRNEITSL